MSISERLERAISEAGSAAKFAHKAGFSAAFICYVRAGKKKASPRLKAALGVKAKSGISVVPAPWDTAA